MNRMIKDRHLRILEALALYKFLTAKQLKIIGVLNHTTTIHHAMREIMIGQKPLVERLSFGLHKEYGKIPFIYYLTKYGVEFLIDNSLEYCELKKINYPIGTATFFYRDCFHRIACIDFQILLRQWADKKNVDVEFFDNYYDKIGSNRKKGSKSIVKTKIQIDDDEFIIPDGAFGLDIKRKKIAFLFELSNGKNTKKIFSQVYRHALAIKSLGPRKKYQSATDLRVLWVLEHQSIKQALMKRITEDSEFSDYRYHFLFKTIAETEQDIFYGWSLFDDVQVDILGRPQQN